MSSTPSSVACTEMRAKLTAAMLAARPTGITLFQRLLADHQRALPHHTDICQLCIDTTRTLQLLDAAPAEANVDTVRDTTIDEVAAWLHDTGYLLDHEEMLDALRALKTGQPSAITNHHEKETMNHTPLPAVIGAALGGGFFAGKIISDGVLYALVVAPRTEGERECAWLESEEEVAGAASYNDGVANTKAMAAAGSDLAQWAWGLSIGGNDDWYIPSMDELEIIYRNLKPTTRSNTQYARAGINLSAMPPTLPYTESVPGQTTVADFMEGGAQAFDDTWYWSSTQHAADADCAWLQNFVSGYQYDYDKSASLRARAVRRFAI